MMLGRHHRHAGGPGFAGRQNETQIAAHAGAPGIAEPWKSKQGSYIAWGTGWT
jgi:hypothetical protein